MGIEPTGKAVEYSGFDLFKLNSDRITERWTYSDNLGLLRQPGAI